LSLLLLLLLLKFVLYYYNVYRQLINKFIWLI